MLDKPEDVLEMMGKRLSVWAGRNPMPAPCKNCPFVLADQGRDYLAPGRLDGIKVVTLLGQPFPCHKTVYRDHIPSEEDDDGFETKPRYHADYRQCAGALEWAKRFVAEHGGVALINGVDES
jgi:hypothetical protein